MFPILILNKIILVKITDLLKKFMEVLDFKRRKILKKFPHICAIPLQQVIQKNIF